GAASFAFDRSEGVPGALCPVQEGDFEVESACGGLPPLLLRLLDVLRRELRRLSLPVDLEIDAVPERLTAGVDVVALDDALLTLLEPCAARAARVGEFGADSEGPFRRGRGPRRVRCALLLDLHRGLFLGLPLTRLLRALLGFSLGRLLDLLLACLLDRLLAC